MRWEPGSGNLLSEIGRAAGEVPSKFYALGTDWRRLRRLRLEDIVFVLLQCPPLGVREARLSPRYPLSIELSAGGTRETRIRQTWHNRPAQRILNLQVPTRALRLWFRVAARCINIRTSGPPLGSRRLELAGRLLAPPLGLFILVLRRNLRPSQNIPL